MGKGVPTSGGGKADRSGWEIQCKGDVVAPDGGVVVITNGALLVQHKSGYKSVFYNIQSDLLNKDVVQKVKLSGKQMVLYNLKYE
ncbi:UNVERIFIED_ORG: hypothetical protein [Escherichia phage CMSTMSU]